MQVLNRTLLVLKREVEKDKRKFVAWARSSGVLKSQFDKL